MVEQQTGGASTPAAAAHASFHDLYEQLERAYHTQPPSELQALLEQRLPQLRACGAALPTRSASARAALDKDTVRVRGVDVRVDDVQRELARAISDRFDVDEGEALALLRTFLESEHRALDTLGTARGADGAFTEFLDAFTVFFFEEQLAVIRCINALLRISEDAQNELYTMAHAVLDQFADASFATQVLEWFERETQEALPPAIRNDVRYTLLWARQGLCKQLALLEVAFLLYYGRLQPTAAFTLAALRTIQRTQFGQRQANAGFLDVPSSVLVECVAHLLLFLAIECLNLEAALEPLDGAPHADDAALAPLVADPEAVEGALEVLDGAASLVYYAPLLLGYALLLRRLDERLEAAPDASLAAVVAVHDGGAPMWRRLAHGALDPSMDLFGVLHALLASPLLGGTDSAVLGASDLSALAYRAVFKGLLLSLTELVQPEYLGDYDALVRLYGAAFGAGRETLAPDAAEGVASLCLQFWTADLPHETRASTLTTARRRFPASFLPLVQLAYALSGNAAPDAFRVPVPGSAAAEASAATLDYLAQLPTLALVLPPGAPGLAPYEILDTPGAPGVQYVVRRAMPVPCTRLLLPVGTRGTLVSPLGAAPSVVLWHLPEPVSAWRVLRDVLALYAAPPAAPAAPRRADEEVWASAAAHRAPPDALSPDCVPGDATVAAQIADTLGAVLGADEGLAAALLTHLEDDDTVEAPRLVAIALDLLRVALPQAPIPTRLVCAAYRIVQRVLPLQPNEVWQRIRSSNVVLGSPGAVPLRASQASLSSAHAGAFSRLLDAEVRTGAFAGTLALLDLLNALVDEVLRALYTDAPALLAVKSEVLVRAVQWVADAVWPAYQRWTYAVPRESLEIGRRCVRLFTRLCEEPHLPPAMQPLVALVEALFGAQCAAARLRPLLTALATSDAEIAALYRAGHTYDARLAEELVEAYLHLACVLVDRHRAAHDAAHAPPHPLVTLFFQPTHVEVHGAAAPVRRSLASIVLQYISAPVPASVACAAAHLTTAMCHVANAPRDARTSLAGTLGSTHELEQVVRRLQGVLENTYGDETLRVAVWRLLSALADSQPALATLLLTGAHRTSNAGGAEKHAPAEAPRAATALQLAIDGMAIATELWDSAPRLLDALLQFLGVAWAHAYEHATAFRPLHADTQLLDALGTLLARPTEPVPVTPASQDAVADAPIALDDAAAAVQTYAYRVLVQARALHLVQMDAQRSASSASARILRSLTADAPQFARRLCAAFATDVEAPHAIEEHLEALVPSVPLAPLRKPPHADAFDARRTFGCAYVFAREAYLEKLYFLPEDVRHDATVLLSSASLAWSRADAQAAREAAWIACLGSCAPALDAPARGSGAPPPAAGAAWLAAARGVLEQAVDVPRDAPPAALVPRARVAAVLLAAAWAHGAPASFDETVALLATLLEHPAYADAPSALGTPLAELVLVVCAAARRAAPDAHAPPSPALAAVAVRALAMLSGVAARAALYAPGSADAHAADAELQLLVAAVQHAAHRPRLAAAWAAPLRDARVLPTCLTLLARAPRAPLDGEAWAPVHVLYLAPLLQLCATLAAQRATCELLAESGVVFALCSNALSAELEQGTLATALPTGDINPLHAHWLVALQIVAGLTETLAAAQAAAGAHFVEGDACAFVQLYAPQLRRTLHYTLPTPHAAHAAPPLDLAQLHEFRAVLRVLYAMHRAKARATPLPLHAELVERLPWVLQQLGYLYTHPRELRTLLGLPEHAEKTDDAHAAADADWQAVVPLATDALVDAIATLLALLWDLSGAGVVLLEDVAEWPMLPALVAPVLHTTPSSPASLGTLLEVASALSDAARALPAKDARRAMLGTALAQSIGLCATQAVLWARGPLPPDASDACRAQTSVAETEIASGLGRDVDAAIRAAQGACTPEERAVLDVLHRFSQQYLGASRSE
ncbi:hypothetical protein CBS9595_002093 [Malassezia furfur]|nr:hypothetical protein CBS9595_002093 [Malassezia furfur]